MNDLPADLNALLSLSLRIRQGHVDEFMEQIYNKVRLHSALGYRSPEEFEQSQKPEVKWSPAALSFLRHDEIYRSDVGS